MFILDASLTITLCFAEEQTPLTREVLRNLDHHRVFVPAIWQFEVSNVLWLGLRRNRLNLQDASIFLHQLAKFDIQTRGIDVQKTLNLANGLDITFYDASYLSLADDMRLPLASLDKRLRSAALKLGTLVLPK